MCQHCQGQMAMNQQRCAGHSRPSPACKFLGIHDVALWPCVFCHVHGVQDATQQLRAWTDRIQSALSTMIPVNPAISKLPWQMPLQFIILGSSSRWAMPELANDQLMSKTLRTFRMVRLESYSQTVGKLILPDLERWSGWLKEKILIQLMPFASYQ